MVKVAGSASGVMVNEARVLAAAVRASDGVICSIDKAPPAAM
jgi:uncharacterized surface protein with fasciclin (FAS1) repeats